MTICLRYGNVVKHFFSLLSFHGQVGGKVGDAISFDESAWKKKSLASRGMIMINLKGDWIAIYSIL